MIGNRRVLGAAVAAVLVASLGALAGCASDEKPETALTQKQVQAASVTLTVHDVNGSQVGIGAGILIAPRLVLTSGHLVAGQSRWTVTSADGTTKVNGIRGMTYDWMDYGGSQNAHPRKHDVAVIYLDKPINLDAYPKLAAEGLANGASGTRLRSNGAQVMQLPQTFKKVVGFPHAYLTNMPPQENVEPGGAVLNEHNEIVGVVTGRGLTTGQMYVARTNDLTDWLQPKAQCGGRSSASVRTYGTPPPKPGCDTPGSSSGGTSGSTSGASGNTSGGTSGSTSGASGNTSGGTSGASSGSSGDQTSSGASGASGGTSGSSGQSSGTSGESSSGASGGSSGGTDNPSCHDGGGHCHGDCHGVPGGSSSGASGGTSGTSGQSSGTSGESSSGASGGASSGASGQTGTSSGASGSSGTSGTSGQSSGTSGETSSSGGASSGASGQTGTSSGASGSSGTSGTSGQSSGSSGQTSSGASGNTSGGTSSGGNSSSGGAGSENNGDSEVCEGESDNSETCPPENDGCSGQSCGGAFAPDGLINYGNTSAGCAHCDTDSSGDLRVH